MAGFTINPYNFSRNEMISLERRGKRMRGKRMKSKQIKAAAAILSAAVVATAIPQIAAFGYTTTKKTTK